MKYFSFLIIFFVYCLSIAKVDKKSSSQVNEISIEDSDLLPNITTKYREKFRDPHAIKAKITFEKEYTLTKYCDVNPAYNLSTCYNNVDFSIPVSDSLNHTCNCQMTRTLDKKDDDLNKTVISPSKSQWEAAMYTTGSQWSIGMELKRKHPEKNVFVELECKISPWFIYNAEFMKSVMLKAGIKIEDLKIRTTAPEKEGQKAKRVEHIGGMDRNDGRR